jgi:drug/metabolite transporter (DMT)-like permease
MMTTMLWVAATLLAATAQTARNATQKALTASLGVMAATQVRFVFGFPCALPFLALACLIAGEAPSAMTSQALMWTLSGAVTQIVATGLMLAAMRERSFAVTTALTKTEPVQAAIVAAVLLGDPLGPGKLASVLIATVGVLILSLTPGQKLSAGALRPLAMGVAAGGFFALAAVCFRGAILTVEGGPFYLKASTILVWGLGLQATILVVALLLIDRAALAKSLSAWRPSLSAGFLGALASQGWFTAFSLTSVANVRTLALVEVLLARFMSGGLFAEAVSKREALGMALIVLGVGGVLMSAI